MTTQLETLSMPRIRENLHETFWGGIRKILYVEASLDLDNGCAWTDVKSYIKVQDDQGPDFTVSIPQPGYEDKSAMWHHKHACLFGPLIGRRGNLYAAPEGC